MRRKRRRKCGKSGDVNAEKAGSLTSSLGYYELEEGGVVGQDQVLFNVHQLICGGHLQFGEHFLLTQGLHAFVEKLVDGVTFLHLTLKRKSRSKSE